MEDDWIKKLMLDSVIKILIVVNFWVFYVNVVIVILLIWIMVVIDIGVVFFGICVVISFIVLFLWFYCLNINWEKKEFIEKYYN